MSVRQKEDDDLHDRLNTTGDDGSRHAYREGRELSRLNGESVQDFLEDHYLTEFMHFGSGRDNHKSIGTPKVRRCEGAVLDSYQCADQVASWFCPRSPGRFITAQPQSKPSQLIQLALKCETRLVQLSGLPIRLRRSAAPFFLHEHQTRA
jgi:hypothetical protein